MNTPKCLEHTSDRLKVSCTLRKASRRLFLRPEDYLARPRRGLATPRRAVQQIEAPLATTALHLELRDTSVFFPPLPWTRGTSTEGESLHRAGCKLSVASILFSQKGTKSPLTEGCK